MAELTTSPEVTTLNDDDILLIRIDGEEGVKHVKWGTIRTAIETGGLTLYYRFGFFFTTTPGDDEILAAHIAVDPFTIAEDFAGWHVGKMPGGVDPDAAWTLTVKHDGVDIGTIGISDAGAVTLTAAAEVEVAAGDVLSFHAPATADEAIAGWAVSVKGAM